LARLAEIQTPPKEGPQEVKAKRIRKTSPIGELPRIVGARSNKPAKIAKVRSFNSLGATETHLVKIIELESNDRATLQVMAKRYRVKSLIHFLEGCLSAEEKRTYQGSQVLFRVYED
jgi:hypothetical protein